jgi:putative intracellular protease/amidase
MIDQRPKIAALIADAFQEEEYFFPKVALNEAGYQVEVVSSRKQPVEIYSYFARTGLLDVERAIADARPEDYVGVLIPGGAKSPALLAEDPRVAKFVQEVSARGGIIACICRGSLTGSPLEGCCRPSHDGVQRQRLLPRTRGAARRGSRRCDLGAGRAGCR